MPITRHTRPISLALAGFVALAALGLGACEGGTSTPSLSDTSYWRGQFAKGQGVEVVVAKGRAAVPLLTSLLGDSNEFVVQTAAMAAQQIGEPAADTVSVLLTALGRFPKQPYVIAAIKAMQGAAVPHLVPYVKSSDRRQQEIGIELLNNIGNDAEPALDALVEIAEDASASMSLRRKALVTIGSIGTPAERMVQRINEIAKSVDELRNDAATANKRIRTEQKVIKKGGDR